jgi:purine-binding chemotaxis protein CheW
VVDDENQPEVSSSIDWQEIHKRLEIAQSRLEEGLEQSAEEQERILRERALVLAREPARAEPEGEVLEVLEFALASETYAIDRSYVREALPLADLTPVPCTPDFVLGIINLRGQILSVVDLKGFFNLPAKGLSELNKVVVVQSPETEFGILADSILGVRRIPLTEIEQSIPTVTGIGAEYLRGVMSDGLIVLAGDRILSDPRMKIHEEVEN